MVNQEQTSGPQSNSGFSSKNTILNDNCAQMVMEEGDIPKIRKPYTISKQRERWSEEEHEKFLEALKLHGRGWKKIEEHIGTKTAVQIRSHAQKFFSKVFRETINSNASLTDPIEIPPPRPKRKPSHPYPRNVALPTKKENPTDQPTRSVSPNSSIYDQDNQSPTSVLSALGSDTLASADSTALDASSSPVSSPDAVNKAEFLPSEDTAPQDDVLVSPSATNDNSSLNLKLFPNIDSYDKQESVSTMTLKLFGKNVVVPVEPTDLSTPLSKSPSSDMGEELLQASPEVVQPMDNDMYTVENPWDCRTFYDVDESRNQMEKPIPLPWWVFFRGMVVPPFECIVENAQEKDSHREGLCAGSSSESVNGVGNTDSNNWDAESQSDKESKNSDEPNMEKKPTLLEKRLNTVKPVKGFVPYKRYFSEKDTQSSTESISEKEDIDETEIVVQN